jgi:uncharacterized protein (TIGR02118 family)
MFKAVGIWSWPKAEDVDEFERYYQSEHLNSASGIPGVEKLTLLRVGEAGKETGVYRIAEMYFTDEAAFEEAERSEGWATMVADATKMIERFEVELKSVLGYEEIS